MTLRESNGTAVFDAFGSDYQRRFQAPEEIVIFAVDCSMSMSEKSDFPEIQDDDVDDDENEDLGVNTNGGAFQFTDPADCRTHFVSLRSSPLSSLVSAYGSSSDSVPRPEHCAIDFSDNICILGMRNFLVGDIR